MEVFPVDLKSDSLRFAKRAFLVAVLILPSFSFAQTRCVNATIDVSKSDAPISKYVFGQFLEHIGGIVNNNIWAEMLDDRKFCFPINSHPPVEPSGPSFRRAAMRHWLPVGADEFVVMAAAAFGAWPRRALTQPSLSDKSRD
jgi:alpha-N-arabinofuranosidase